MDWLVALLWDGASRPSVGDLHCLGRDHGARCTFQPGGGNRPAVLPDYSGELVLPGLIGTVEVKRDSYGVPHVYADNPEDLFLAQGYIQASDRFYEMDYRRHLAAGRLSELYGPSQVEADPTSAPSAGAAWPRRNSRSCQRAPDATSTRTPPA